MHTQSKEARSSHNKEIWNFDKSQSCSNEECGEKNKQLGTDLHRNKQYVKQVSCRYCWENCVSYSRKIICVIKRVSCRLAIQGVWDDNWALSDRDLIIAFVKNLLRDNIYVIQDEKNDK